MELWNVLILEFDLVGKFAGFHLYFHFMKRGTSDPIKSNGLKSPNKPRKASR